MNDIIYDKVSNHYPNGNCSTLNEAINYTKQIMTFLNENNLLSETGIEAFEDWNSNSQIDSSMLVKEGSNLLDIYFTRWNNHRSVADTQEKVTNYWSNRLYDLRTYNNICVRNESSFKLFYNPNKKDLSQFLNFVDANVSENTRHILFECERDYDKFIIKHVKGLDEHYNKISLPILENLSEGFILGDWDKNNTILGTCKYVKEIWNESSRVYNYDFKIQPDTRKKQYYKVQ